MRPEQLFYKVAAEDTARPEGRERPEMPRMEDYTKSLTGIAGAAGSGALMTKYLPMTSDFAKKHPIARGALYAGGLSAGGLAVRAGVDLGRHTAYHTGQAASKGIEAGKRAVNYRRDDNSSSTPKYKALRQFDSEREKNAETVGLGIGLKEGPRAYGIRAAKGDEDERGLAFSYDVVPAAVAGVPLGAAVAAATNSPSLMATVLREKNRNAAISSAIQDAAIARAEVERLKNQYALRMDAARDVADSDGSGAEEIARKMRAAAAAVDPADFVPSPEVVKALGRRARAAAGGALSGMATAAAAQGLHNMAQYYTGKVLANPGSTSESGDPEPTTEEYADIQDPPEKKKAWHHSRTRFRITNSMGKKAEVEYRGKRFPGYNQPVDSDRPEKKKMVLAKKGDKVKLIHFGQKGYKHNYSEAAKKNYLTRSAGIRGKDGSLTANDKFSANYWARRELWPKNEPADGSARNREKRASDDAFRDYLLSMGALSAGTLRHRANTSHEPAATPAKKNKGMKKVAYSENEHRGLAEVTASETEPRRWELLSAKSGHRKIAAPKYLKQLRSLVSSGDISGAQELARKLDAAGVLKKTEKGSIIKILGSGAEGPAALAVGSTDSPVPLSVMKMFDRGGALYDRGSLSEKFNMLRRARASNNPEIARLYSPRIRRGAGGTPFYHAEFVPGHNTDYGLTPAPSVFGKGSTEFTQALMLPTGESFGMGSKKMLADVVGNFGNTVRGPTGKKIIDFVPTTSENAQRMISGSTPGFRRAQRWVGIPEHTTAPSLAAAAAYANDAMPRLMDPAVQQKMNKLERFSRAEALRTLYGMPNLSNSDLTGEFLRRADQRRTLRGLSKSRS